MVTLYILSFAASLFSLVAWYHVEDNAGLNKLLRGAVFGGLGLYLFSLLSADAVAMSDKLFFLFRDLLVMGLSVMLFQLAKAHSTFMYILLLGLYFGFQFTYYDMMGAAFAESIQGSSTASAEAGQNNDTAYANLSEDGELLVELREGADRSTLQPLLDEFGLTAEAAFSMADRAATDLDDYLVLDIPQKRLTDLPAITARLHALDAVEYLEYNELVQMTTDLSDVLNDPAVTQQWAHEVLDPTDWYALLSETKPKKRALIAILDTGVDADHEDLKANYVSTRKQYDTDGNSHGTHCAGVAAAVSNNGIGIASLVPSSDYVQVTSIKVLDAFGGGTQRSIINGMLEAADAGADVVSMSLGGRSDDAKQRAYAKAIKYITDKGGIVVTAAGNDSGDARDHVPASVDGVITVAAIGQDGQLATFSNTVDGLKMGLAAPGADIYSTIPDNKYASYNGTSMATPYVAGTIGILRSLRPELTAQEAYRLLTSSAAARSAEGTPTVDPIGALVGLQE